jgi:superoxide reductase
MKRREFLRNAFIASGTLVVATTFPKNSMAASTYLDGIIYTKNNEGRWKSRSGSHVPVIEVNGTSVKLTNNHEMSQEHYIVKHTLVSQVGEVIGEKTFYVPADKKAVSTFELPKGYKGKLYATAFCNHHDLWLAEINI